MPSLTEVDRNRDAYYTPHDLAREVVAAVRVTPQTIMDPAVGDGSLLRAASERWPTAQVVGLDVDRNQLERTRADNREWSLGRVDMFSPRSRAASALWRSAGLGLDLVLLNPPFSYRGGRSRRVTYEGDTFALTPASAFVALALTRLGPGGELLALLPAGVRSLERDAAFWSSVGEAREVETVAEYASTAFSGTRTRSILVAIRPRTAGRPAEVFDLPVHPRACVELVRGRVPVHRLSETKGSATTSPFLHTRDLEALVGVAETGVQAPSSLATGGPFLTLPRVGRVRAAHVKVVTSPDAVVLSDCVFAMRAETGEVLTLLQAALLADLQVLQDMYVGGCAPYLTIRRLNHFLSLRGYCVHHVSASSPPGASWLSGGCTVGTLLPPAAGAPIQQSARA